MYDWQRAAIDDLMHYHDLEAALENIPLRQLALSCDAGAVRSSMRDDAPVSGSGSSSAEDRLIDNLCKREALGGNRKSVEARLVSINNALGVLSKRERRILQLFYIERAAGYLDRLCDELAIEKSQAYREKDKALRKFAIAMYGVAEYL